MTSDLIMSCVIESFDLLTTTIGVTSSQHQYKYNFEMLRMPIRD